MKHLLVLILSFIPFLLYPINGFTFTSSRDLTYSISEKEAPVVKTAFEIFSNDYRNVFGRKLKPASGLPDLIVATLGVEDSPFNNSLSLKELEGKSQAYLIQIVDSRTLYVIGSDKYGTAYGLDRKSVV